MSRTLQLSLLYDGLQQCFLQGMQPMQKVDWSYIIG
jgi:hypothetical protein